MNITFLMLIGSLLFVVGFLHAENAGEPKFPNTKYPDEFDDSEYAPEADLSLKIKEIETICITALDSKKSIEVERAIRALTELRSTNAIRKLVEIADYESPISVGDGQDPLLSYPACRALVVIGPAAIPEIRKRISKEEKITTKTLLILVEKEIINEVELLIK